MVKYSIYKTVIMICFIPGFFVVQLPLYAQGVQEVVSSAGAYHNTSQGSLSWTIGEGITETMTAYAFMLTSGFHQSELTITAIAATGIPEADVRVYPNPVTSYLTVETAGDPQDYEVLLYDLQGNLLYRKDIFMQTEVVDMRFYAPGVYLIRIVKTDNSKQKYFQVIKH